MSDTPHMFKVYIGTFVITFRRGKGKVLPQQAEVAQGVLGRLRPRIFLMW